MARPTKIYIPSLGLVIDEIKEYWFELESRFSVGIEIIPSPFINISRQKILDKANRDHQPRAVFLDDDVILPDDAIDFLLSHDTPLNLLSYPAKHDDSKIVAGDLRSEYFPTSVFPSYDLWLDNLPTIGDAPFRCFADWCGFGAASISMDYYITAPYFDLSQHYNPWLRAPLFAGEDITYLRRMAEWAPELWWIDYVSSNQFLIDQVWPRNKFMVTYYPGTKHLQRIRSSHGT